MITTQSHGFTSRFNNRKEVVIDVNSALYACELIFHHIGEGSRYRSIPLSVTIFLDIGGDSIDFFRVFVELFKQIEFYEEGESQ